MPFLKEVAALETIILLLFIISGLAYLFLLDNKKVGPYIKILPALFLTIYALLSSNLLFALIFILAATGDYLLTRKDSFYQGVCVFAAAYTILNLTTFAYFHPLYLLALVPFFTVFFMLKEGLIRENVFYQFLAYGIVVIAFLVVNATGHLAHAGRQALGFGLLSLAFSDLLIAARFARPSKVITTFIMIAYYGGLLLVSGLIL